MFKYFIETRELKKMRLQYQVLLLSRLHAATNLLDNIPSLIEVVNKVKDMDATDAQKEIINSIIDYMKAGKE